MCVHACVWCLYVCACVVVILGMKLCACKVCGVYVCACVCVCSVVYMCVYAWCVCVCGVVYMCGCVFVCEYFIFSASQLVGFF